MKYSLLIFSFLICFTSLSQDKKQEKEERLKRANVPGFMTQLIAPYAEEARRLRYYEEFDGQSTSYEAKFILYEKHFSAEFSKEGKLEDVEVIRCFTELPTDTQDRIVDYLYPNDNFKIKKTQKQFWSEELSDSALLDAAIKNLDLNDIRYELIVQVKKEGEWTTYEMLFDKAGNFISQREVVARSEDHLLY